MRRPALYSSSRRSPSTPVEPQAARSEAEHGRGPAPAPANDIPAPPSAAVRWPLRRPTSQHLLWLLVLAMASLLVLGLGFDRGPMASGPRLTQKDIDAAVLQTLSTQALPSEYAKAYEAIAPSVVRVTSYIRRDRLKPDVASKIPRQAAGGSTDVKDDEVESGVGTGVVIVDKGIILTNLHVVTPADRIRITFSDGLEAEARVINVQPENDLAVLQANKIPDDLIAATLRSTGDLRPGDKVMAVGYPFGIGPSASGGVVSGLRRVFRSPEGKQEMSNLIQFDAAANPGNSGGPLITMDGEVVGIVTAILNPTPARTFLGIGFAVPIENAASAVGLPPF